MTRMKTLKKTRMFLTPSTAGTVIEKIEEGAIIIVLRMVNDMWLEVSHNGKRGFMMSCFLQEVRDTARKGGGRR